MKHDPVINWLRLVPGLRGASDKSLAKLVPMVDRAKVPAGHVLTTLANVTLSAHSAFRTPEASDTLIRRALDIARRVCGVPA